VEAFASSTLQEAEEVLSQHGIALVFCDDHLPDGSYRDLLKTLRTSKKAPHIVVTTRIGEWKDYVEALGLGVLDMIQYPYRLAEVELNVIRAMRGPDQKSARAIA
jgi:DNA-binding response OmpR family regulator